MCISLKFEILNNMKLTNSLCKALSQIIIKFGINQPLHCILLLLNTLQTMLCVLKPQSCVFNILKWFDLSFLFDPNILFIVVLVLTLLCGFSIFIQIYWAAEHEKLSRNILQHYTIKITSGICFIISHTLCLTIIRCSVMMIKNPDLLLKILGILELTVYIGIVYIFSMFLVTDLSPQNERVYSSLTFPNCLTFVNVYRPVVALMVAMDLTVFALIPTSIVLLAMIRSIWNQPIFNWKFNIASIVYVGAIAWTIVYRIVSIGSGEDINIGTFFTGIPIFVVFLKWTISKRLEAITLNQENSVGKLKLLYYMLLNRETYKKQLSIFLVEHCSHCRIETCSCQKLLTEIHPKRGDRETIRKPASNKLVDACKPEFILEEISETKKAVEKELEIEDRPIKQTLKAEERLWFQLLLDLQNEKFSIEKLRQLPPSEMEALIKQIRNVLFDQVEVLHYELDKQYQSLRCFWFAKGQSVDRLPLFTRVRSVIEEARQEETIERKSKEEGSNVYTLNYYELQIRMLEFKRFLLDISLKTKSFWTEFLSEKPDNNKANKLLEELLSARRNFLNYKQDLITNWLGNSSNDFQTEWNSKIQNLLQEMTEQFERVMHNTQIEIPNMKMSLINLSNQSKYVPFDKKMQFYDVIAITAMGVVNVKDGQEFGEIVNSNREFWRLMGYEKYNKPHINDFLIKEMHDYHNKTVVNFLKLNKHLTKFHRGFVNNSQNMIMEIQFSIQVLPHLEKGLYAATFFQQVCSPCPIILVNGTSQILSFNNLFKQQYLKNQPIEFYQQIITKKTIKSIQQFEQYTTTINEQQIRIKLCRRIPGNTEDQVLYYCEINIFLDNVPRKQALKKGQRAAFYFGANQIQERKQQTTMKIQSRKQKQKDRSIHHEGHENQNRTLNAVIKTQTGFKLKFWRIIIMVALFIAFVLTGLCAFFSQARRSAYMNSLYQQRNVTRMLQWTAEMAFLARKVNILSFNGAPKEEILPYVSEVEAIKKQITIEIRIMPTSIWNETFFYYELFASDTVSMNKTIIEMVLEMFILSSCTTFLEGNFSEWSFDYIHTLNQIPFSSIYTNFRDMLQNTHYVYIPKVAKQFKILLHEIIKNNVTIPTPIVPISIVIFFIGFLIQALTTLYRYKLHFAIIRGLMVLEKMDVSNVRDRIQSIQMYVSIFLKEVSNQKSNQRAVFSVMAVAEEVCETHLNYANQMTNRPLDLPHLDIQTIETPKNKQEIKEEQKITKIQKEQQQNKINLIHKYSGNKQIFVNGNIGIIPILLLSVLIIGYQVSINYTAWDLLNLRELNSQKLQNILLLNSLSFEVGYQMPYFRSKNISISNQLDDMFQQIYKNNRQLRDAEDISDKKFTSYSKQVRYITICNVIDMILLNKEDTYQCTELERIQYGSRNLDQIFVDFIQTARSLHFDYKTKPYVPQNQRDFCADSRHQEIQKLGSFLRVIQHSINIRVDAQYQQFNKNYQITIVLICVVTMLTIIAVQRFWLRKEFHKIMFYREKVKIILWLIIGTQLKINLELKKQMKDQIKYFSIMN